MDISNVALDPDLGVKKAPDPRSTTLVPTYRNPYTLIFFYQSQKVTNSIGALQRKSPLCIPFLGIEWPLSFYFYIHVSVKEVHIPTIHPPVFGEAISNDIFASGIIRISLWRGGGGLEL
jgi:hypothetical protein